MPQSPPLPEEISTAMQGYEPATREALLGVRDLMFEAASENPAIGSLTETLKWGEASYLTEKSKSGSTVRLGQTRKGKQPAVFVNCKTTLVAQFKQHYGDRFDYEGERALVINDADAMSDAIKHCLALVLTYHLRK